MTGGGHRNTQKGRAACVVSHVWHLAIHLGVIATLALLLLLAVACGALARLHLVHDEARVALFAVPLEALEVGVCELVIGLVENVISQFFFLNKNFEVDMAGQVAKTGRTFFLNCL